jgi:hypothetical protein
LPSVKLLWFVGTKLERAFCVGTCGEHRNEFASPEPIAASATIIPVTATGFDFEAERRAIARQRRCPLSANENEMIDGSLHLTSSTMLRAPNACAARAQPAVRDLLYQYN